MKMPTEAEIRLAAGELTAGEMRTVKAVLQWFINTRCSEADQRDAARYRWLREKMTHERVGPHYGWCISDLIPGDDPDSAIDAAMRQSASMENK